MRIRITLKKLNISARECFTGCVILAPSILNERRMVHIFTLIDINRNYKISKLQIAKESDWEECMIIKEASHINSLKEWCASVTCENIAAEAFFDMPEKNMRDAFIGVRIKASPETFVLLLDIFQEFTRMETYCLGSFISSIESYLNGCLFQSIPDYSEVGVVNYWNSFGSVKLCSKDFVSCKAEALKIFETNSKWKTPPAQVAIEFAYTHPIQHWIGIPADNLQKSPCRL